MSYSQHQERLGMWRLSFIFAHSTGSVRRIKGYSNDSLLLILGAHWSAILLYVRNYLYTQWNDTATCLRFISTWFLARQDPINTGQADRATFPNRMASSPPVTRVVSKEKYDQQYFLDVNLSKLPSLAASSVRIQSQMFALSSNNLSYCAMGDVLHWWKAFALPSYLPAPFNDPEAYGIPPGWGIAHVVESTIPELEPGQTLFGFIPTSTMLADLQLEQSEDVPGHWFEVSKHREQLMSLYNRYLVTGGEFSGQYGGVDAAY